MIEIFHKSQDGSRTGNLILSKGKVETPVFMPVGTNGTVKAVLHENLHKWGYRLILGNTYHLFLRPGAEVLSRAGGLHQFSSWQDNILTDSGGYQVFSLPGLRKITDEGIKFQSHIDGSRHMFSPQSVIDFQALMGSDIAMQLDVCTAPGVTWKEADKALGLTTSWLDQSLKQRLHHPGWSGEVFGIIQGNFFKDLRERSALEILSLNPDGVAIGGLSVGESPDQFEETLSWVSPLLPPDKARYVMGIGTPDLILSSVAQGIDMFDCVYPTRIARNGTVMTGNGQLDLVKSRFVQDHSPIDQNCSCSACRNYSRAFIRHLFKAKEILGPMLATEHNLVFMQDFLGKIRLSILENRFPSFRKSFLEAYYSKE